MYRPERFAYRLIRANDKINDLLSYEFKYSKIENPTFNDKDLLCIKIKFAYEFIPTIPLVSFNRSMNMLVWIEDNSLSNRNNLSLLFRADESCCIALLL